MKILIENVQIIGATDETTIAIAKGKITSVGAIADFVADITIDAKGLLAIPGMVDLSARLREPGASKSGTIATETQAAVASGITTVCMPPDTDPIIDNPAVVELIEQRQEQAGFSKVLPLAAMTQGLKGKHLAAVGSLQEEGCVGVSQALRPFDNTQVLYRALQYAATFEMTAHLHPLNYALVADGSAHQGEVANRLGLPGISQAAETTALAQILMLAEEAGAKIHICRLSCARSIELIKQAKARGVQVTADVAIHQLFYTEQDLFSFDSCFHVMPPFRSKVDRQALRQAVIEGEIDAICSDHQPCDVDSKLSPFSVSATGISALDSFLSDVLRFCAEEKIELNDIMSALNKHPAQILNQDENEIKVGKPANLSLLDTKVQWTLSADEMYSKGKNTPQLNEELKGLVSHTIMDGQLVFTRKN